MERFRNHQRVRVVLGAQDLPAVYVRALSGKTGTIERLRRADDGAWVTMDDDLPEGLRSFPKGDPRQNNVLLYPEECEEA